MPSGFSERSRADVSAGRSGPLARRTVLVVSIALGLFATLFTLWHGSGALLTILAGLVAAALFDMAAHGLGHVLPVARRIRLFIVVALFFLIVGAAIVFGGATLTEQVREFTSGSQGVFEALNEWLAASPVGAMIPDGYTARDLLSGLLGGGGQGEGQALIGGASVLFGAATTAVLIVFFGCFIAWNPALYRTGVLSLLPKDKRDRIGEVLDRMARTMRDWLMGQFIGMAIVGALTTGLLLLVGMPFAFLLGLQAALLAFIPMLGALLAAVPILIAGATEGTTMILYGLGVYVAVQTVESNLITPIVQKRAVSLAPAFILGTQLILGALFGFAGLALAVPLMALTKVAVEALYVEDDLGGGATGREGRGEDGSEGGGDDASGEAG